MSGSDDSAVEGHRRTSRASVSVTGDEPRQARPKWSTDREPEPPIRFLIVCTANRCRSPMAEELLRARLRSVAAPTLVSSAGTLAENGLPAMREALAVVGGPAGHTSRHLTVELLEEADLVLCMTREHVRTVAMLLPGAFTRTFTVRELARRAGASGPRRPGEQLDAWLAWVATGRRMSDLVGYHDPDDITDPIGEPVELYQRCATDLDALLASIVSLVFPAG